MSYLVPIMHPLSQDIEIQYDMILAAILTVLFDTSNCTIADMTRRVIPGG